MLCIAVVTSWLNLYDVVSRRTGRITPVPVDKSQRGFRQQQHRNACNIKNCLLSVCPARSMTFRLYEAGLTAAGQQFFSVRPLPATSGHVRSRPVRNSAAENQPPVRVCLGTVRPAGHARRQSVNRRRHFFFAPCAMRRNIAAFCRNIRHYRLRHRVMRTEHTVK